MCLPCCGSAADSILCVCVVVFAVWVLCEKAKGTWKKEIGESEERRSVAMHGLSNRNTFRSGFVGSNRQDERYVVNLWSGKWKLFILGKK